VLDGAANLSEVSRREQAAGLSSTERLACMALVHGPVTITTSYW
jgi:ferredoxin